MTATHPALIRAQEVYDRHGDLEPHEQEFLKATHRITMHCARTKGDAVIFWGLGSRAYDAVAYLAHGKQRYDLTVALEQFEAAVPALDEVEEIQAAVVVAAE